MAKSKNVKRPPWVALESYYLPAARGRKKNGTRRFVFLTVGVNPTNSDEWSVIAIEAPDAANVLDNHSHELIGTFSRKADAFDAAEAWLARWHSAAAPAAERCACKGIDSSAKKKTRRPTRRR